MDGITDVGVDLDKYIDICRDFFEQRGYEAQEYPSLHDELQWRPHLLLERGEESLALEVRVTEELKEFWLEEIEKAQKLFPDLKVFAAIPAEAEVLPELLVDAGRLGIGVYEIQGTLLIQRTVPQVAEETIPEELTTRYPTFVVRRDTPYGNIQGLRQILRMCQGHIHWLDKHFTRKGLERIYEDLENLEGITEVRILCGLYLNNITDALNGDVDRLRKEFNGHGIDLQLRVICNRDVLDQLHDRFIISEGFAYNVLPVNSLEMGQLGQMFATDFEPPFQELWDTGLDIIAQWGEVKSEREELRKRKEGPALAGG